MTRLYKSLKKTHKWLGVVLAIFFIFFALSGIIMNHRGAFSRFDVSRNWLPKDYRYSNWNNASVRGTEHIGNDSLLIYGNIGIWLTNKNFTYFKNLNKGFPKGIDNRKISDVHKTNTGDIFASTMFGLYRFKLNSDEWEKVSLPITEQRIVALEELGDSLLVVSRSHILLGYGSDNYQSFSTIHLSAPKGAVKKVSLFKTIWFIHSGKILGTFGKIIVDIIGIATILLSLTGLFYFLAPKFLRRIKSGLRIKSRIKQANRWSYKWHLKVGVIAALLLLVVTSTGMFLRPPLLIPIANKTVNPIKGSQLDSQNFWYDKLRELVYDTTQKVFLLATSDGIHFVPTDFSQPPFKAPFQPPVSVMGINVFWQEGAQHFAVGSFSGLYRWNPYKNEIVNYLSGKEAELEAGLRSPFGNTPISGGIQLNNGEKIFFDYNKGAFSTTKSSIFPDMPKEIIKESGMSLWNLALEVHTWRIIKFLIGDFYILIVPLSGLFGIVITVTGIIMWFIKNKRRRNNNQINT
ncbi:MAG: PepSY-associated TM helix domain-containing protein [Perlabentimonas sp.]